MDSGTRRQGGSAGMTESLMPKHVVAPVRDIPPGGRKAVAVNGRAIVVFNLGGEFFALTTAARTRAAP